MLKGIQKLMGKEQEKQVEMSVEELSEQLTTATASLAEVTEKFASLQADYDVIKKALDASEQAKELIAKQAKEKELAARKEKIVASVGTERADALLAAVEGLSDEQFSAVVGAVAMSAESEAKSPMFTEAGVQGETDLSKVDEKSSLEAKLAEKYHSK